MNFMISSKCQALFSEATAPMLQSAEAFLSPWYRVQVKSLPKVWKTPHGHMASIPAWLCEGEGHSYSLQYLQSHCRPTFCAS